MNVTCNLEPRSHSVLQCLAVGDLGSRLRYMSERLSEQIFNVSLSFPAQSTKNNVCNLPYSISVKSYRTFSKQD